MLVLEKSPGNIIFTDDVFKILRKKTGDNTSCKSVTTTHVYLFYAVVVG